MKILSRIFKPSSSRPQRGAHEPQIGNVESVCPYCGSILERKPSRKRKCPECGQTIHVRKRPSDGATVLLTADQAQQIDEQRERRRELKEWERRRKDPEFVSIERQLRKKWGREPSLSDVLWALANKRLLRHAARGDWGLYRNTKLEMAEILHRWSKRPSDALRFYLEVFFLDLSSLDGGNCAPYY
jgi:DNA-directed RNA polymerase subunit M/transcription elongation factor TFIIS